MTEGRRRNNLETIKAVIAASQSLDQSRHLLSSVLYLFIPFLKKKSWSDKKLHKKDNRSNIIATNFV